MSTNEVKNKLKLYAKVLRENKINFSCIYLFGSYSSGRQKFESDIDVAVIIPKIGKGAFELESKLWTLAPQVDSRIEPVLLEENDIQSGTASMVGSEVRKAGVRVV